MEKGARRRVGMGKKIDRRGDRNGNEWRKEGEWRRTGETTYGKWKYWGSR